MTSVDLPDWTPAVVALSSGSTADLPDWTWAVLGPDGNPIGGTGTGGGGAPTDPGLPNLTLQWDASRLAGANASLVSSWPPVVGSSAYTLAQANSAHQPTLYTTTPANLQNGLPTVRFAGSQWLQSSGPPPSLPEPLSLYLIMALTGAADPQTMVDGLSSSGRLGLYKTGGSWNSNVNNFQESSTVACPTGIHCAIEVAQAASPPQLYVDGTSYTMTNTPTAASLIVGTIGADYTGGAGITGYICEVGVYSAALTSGQWGTVRAYARTKWAAP